MNRVLLGQEVNAKLAGQTYYHMEEKMTGTNRRRIRKEGSIVEITLLINHLCKMFCCNVLAVMRVITLRASDQ